MVIMWTCENGHLDYRTSSKVLCEKKAQKVFANTMLMAAVALNSGNSFEKMRTCPHQPEVPSLWEETNKEIWAVVKNESLIFGGDGGSDSPGFYAKYVTYVVMEQFLEVIVDIEVTDKRETVEFYQIWKLLA